MKKINTSILAISILVSSCGSTKINRIKNLASLDKDEEIVVYYDKAPTFSYEKICEAQANSSFMFVKTKPKQFVSKAEKIARECGGKIAIIEGVSGYTTSKGGGKVTAKIIVVKKTSSESKLLKNKEGFKKLTTAMSMVHTNNTYSLLKKLKVPKKRKDRSNYDNRLLDAVMKNLAERSENCPSRFMNKIYKDYQVLVDLVEDKPSLIRVDMHNVMSCPIAKIMKSSFIYSKDKKQVIMNINKVYSNAINDNYLNKNQRTMYNNLFPIISKVVNKSCDRSDTSELCSMKKNLNKIYKLTK